MDLADRGLMSSPGLAAIDRAKTNGSWERFDLAESLTIAPDVMDVFESDAQFARAWDELTDSKKRQFLQQIYDAKTESTRMKRLEALRQALSD